MSRDRTEHSSLLQDDSVTHAIERRTKLRVKWAARTLATETIQMLVDVELPWRENRTPYRVFLAEFLLIRTRTDVVAKYFEQIVAKLPDIYTLAETDEQKIAEVIAPLGLHRRSSFLKRAALHITNENEGVIPNTLDRLMSVPGLGTYSALAILAFAFDSKQVPADVNILRFLSRLTGLPMVHRTKGSRHLRGLLPYLSTDQHGPPTEYLLDFTRLVCKSRKPKCDACPLQARCVYFVDTPNRGKGK